MCGTQTDRQLPADPDGMNDNRAGWAERAVAAFQYATMADDEDALSDLLADLRHWTDRNGQDWQAQLDRAMRNYEAETSQ